MEALVRNAVELEELLINKYGSRIVTDSFSALMGSIGATFDNEKIVISFDGNYLVFSAKSKSVYEELLPTLSEVMAGVHPICEYDLEFSDEENYHTIEWDIKEPEKRIVDIVNGNAFRTKLSKMTNLVLKDGRKIEDYIQNNEEKISGIYPGNLGDLEAISDLNEIDLFLKIDALSLYIWETEHNMAQGKIPNTDLTEEKYALEYLVYQTTKFGVELPEPQVNQHIVVTPSYKFWYQFYSSHFKKYLTTEEWFNFLEAKANGEDVSQYLPSGSWKSMTKDYKI